MRRAAGNLAMILPQRALLQDKRGNIAKRAEWVLNSKSASAEALLVVERRILEMVASGDSLAEILDNLCQL